MLHDLEAEFLAFFRRIGLAGHIAHAFAEAAIAQ